MSCYLAAMFTGFIHPLPLPNLPRASLNATVHSPKGGSLSQLTFTGNPQMNWLKDLFWCETWLEFFRHLGLALVLLAGLWAGLWVVMIAGEL